MKLTHSQMLNLWRRAAGMGPEGSPSSVEAVEDTDTTVALARDMRDWYLRLLDEGDIRYLYPEDVVDRTVCSMLSPRLCMVVLPEDVRRVVWMIVDNRVVYPCNLQDADKIARRLENKYSSRIVMHPHAFFTKARNVIDLLCPSGQPEITAVYAVTDPGEEMYVLDEAALSLLPRAVERTRSFFEL